MYPYRYIQCLKGTRPCGRCCEKHKAVLYTFPAMKSEIEYSQAIEKMLYRVILEL